MPELVHYKSIGRVALITLDRPEALNAFHQPLFDALNAAIDRFHADPEAFVAVIASDCARAFSAGIDLKSLDADIAKDPATAYGPITFTTKFVTAKPIIAAVHGHCVGEGICLALACDLIVADETAQFSIPEARVGTNAVDIPVMLARLLGYQKAFAFIADGLAKSASWCADAGLVEVVTPAGEVRRYALELADRIATENAPLAMQAQKESLWRAFNESEEAGRAAGQRWRKITRPSKDFAEGRAAFAEKRKPVFRGE